jgi:hypothetical protein
MSLRTRTKQKETAVRNIKPKEDSTMKKRKSGKRWIN